MIDAPTATWWLALLGGAAVARGALDLLAARAGWRDDGVLPWRLLRARVASAPRPLRVALDAALGDRGFTALLLALVAGGLALPWAAHAALPAAVALGLLLVAVRFGGSYNGGSDAMLLVVVSGLAVARVAPRAGLAWVAAQLVLSYVVAGWSKLRTAGWRDGTALVELLAAPQYAAPATVARALARPVVARAASWAVMGLECGFALALVVPGAAAPLLAGALAFHLANAVVLGLDRFLWAWVAAFPALLHWAR